MSTAFLAGLRPRRFTDSIVPALVGSGLGVVMWVPLGLVSALTSAVAGRWLSYAFALFAMIVAGRLIQSYRRT